MNFIQISRPSIEKKEIEYVTDAIKSGWVSSTGEKYIDIFEEKFAQKTFCTHQRGRTLKSQLNYRSCWFLL